MKLNNYYFINNINININFNLIIINLNYEKK